LAASGGDKNDGRMVRHYMLLRMSLLRNTELKWFGKRSSTVEDFVVRLLSWRELHSTKHLDLRSKRSVRGGLRHTAMRGVAHSQSKPGRLGDIEAVFQHLEPRN